MQIKTVMTRTKENAEKTGITGKVWEVVVKHAASLPPGTKVKFWWGTEAEYDALPHHDENTFYMFTGEWS